ncbi:uncharacterized protein EV420DRAFT_1166733 [Desarmillaria tabescens]|uniref:Uncharacterized protein n=1 Tax=Armillaria tabescens TaxID=1929756 RepID=A0AA39JCW0_ARMTA|nr:uncharacterized protein EV420DRAFT_1166733 [Desarmillaria tabescens]KAK0440009.1 hypothetical protein EV420DRAFT_1166733 [Desarmillaria tabescens]
MSGLCDDRPFCSGNYYGPIAPINSNQYPATYHTPSVLGYGSTASYSYTYTHPHSNESGFTSMYDQFRAQFEAMSAFNTPSEGLSGECEDACGEAEEYEDEETADNDHAQILNEYGKRHIHSLHSSKRLRLNEIGDAKEITPVLAPKQNQAAPIQQESIVEVPQPRLIKALPKRSDTIPNPPQCASPPRSNPSSDTPAQKKTRENLRLLMRKASVSLTSRPNAEENVKRFLSSLKRLPSEKNQQGECMSRLSRLERYRWLCEDEWAANVDRTYVNCVGCGRKVQLDKRADAEWYLSLWVKHRDKCHMVYEKWQRREDAVKEQLEKENTQK